MLTLVLLSVTPAQAAMIGINVLLNQPASDNVLADLSTLGQVLEVIPEINAVMMRAQASKLPAIQALPCVAGANPDAPRSFTSVDAIPVSDLAGGGNQWSLDAINVADAGTDPARTVDYDGDGVYIAVLDTGLVSNWRDYFPEQRLATQFARAFGGGGGNHGTITDQPIVWEHETWGHGTAVISIILGFQYLGPEDLPLHFNGVAPKATIIPVRFIAYAGGGEFWSSQATRGLMYVTDLKTSGALGAAPLVINMSFGSHDDPDFVEQAAIDYAIAQGVIIVAGAGNHGEFGMAYPAAYEPVISAAGTGSVDQWPADDPTTIDWILRDVAEGTAQAHFVWDESSRELPGQDLDVAAPGAAVPVPWTTQEGHADYSFFFGTSGASPHVAGVAALLLQKNPNLTQSEIETILEGTAMPLPPGCRDLVSGMPGPGNEPTWGDHNNAFFFPATYCWGADAAGHGLLQADAALAATPMP
jgi:subtilisin family serine protease